LANLTCGHAQNWNTEPAGFQNSAATPDLALYTARSDSLMKPPRPRPLCCFPSQCLSGADVLAVCTAVFPDEPVPDRARLILDDLFDEG
jgi:hypothetical protein